MTKYQKAKGMARDAAIEWQANFCNEDYSWGELMMFADHWYKVGKRYGLLREFAENGLI